MTMSRHEYFIRKSRNCRLVAAGCLFFTLAVSAAALFGGIIGTSVFAKAAAVFVKGSNIPGFANVVKYVKPAVVSVQVKGAIREPQDPLRKFWGGSGLDRLPDDHPLKRFFREFEENHSYVPREEGARIRPIAQGSGFFISEDGYVVTNNHVVTDGSVYTLVLDDGTELEAKLVGTDPRTDLAVLKTDPDHIHNFTYVSFADDNTLHIGDWVVAVGNPFGLGGTVTAGIVSARGRDIGAGVYDDFIQIDAAVNRGNSGGPTFNLNGQVVGINTAIFSPSGGSVGIAFAIPSSTASQVVHQLIEKGTVERGWLGVQIQPVSKEIANSVGLDDAKGAMIADPMEGPAAKAGIRAGDIIVAVNGEEIQTTRDLARKIALIKPGEHAILSLWRGGKKEDIKVKIAAMPSSGNPTTVGKFPPSEEAVSLEAYGFTVIPGNNGRGVLVTHVDPSSDAAEKGIRPGDIILSINNIPITNAKEIMSVINKAIKLGRKAVLLQIEANEQSHFIALPIQKK